MTVLPAILDQPVDLLDMSQSLKNMLRNNRLTDLKDLLRRPMEEWFQFKGFSQHLLQELMGYLEKNALVPLVRD